MKQSLRRLGYVFLGLVWLAVMSFPVFAVLLASQQELAIGDPEHRQLRVFLVQEEEADGIGLLWTRPASGAGGTCTQSSLYYLMWRGKGEAARYCRCFDERGGVVSNTSGYCTAPR